VEHGTPSRCTSHTRDPTRSGPKARRIDRYMNSSDADIRTEFEQVFTRVKKLGFNASVAPTGPPVKREIEEKEESEKKKLS
jgi:hypothetical protein